MYRQIRVDERDAHYRAIVWRFNHSDPLQVYYLNTFTYGLVSSPWQATRTLRQLASDNVEKFPLARVILQKEGYMDDMISGDHSIESAVEKQCQLIELLRVGGMSLRKWASNHPDLLSRLSSEELAGLPEVIFQDSSVFRVLGLQWQAKEDCFKFKINCGTLPSKFTKRSVLSQIAQIFDPTGWLAPVIVTAKIFMQRLWLLGCD